MIKIGLTGGICCGKSLVLSFFQQLGAYTLKADELSKAILFGQEPKLRNQLCEALGILNNNQENIGAIQEKISKILFSNPDKRLLINRIVHPHVIAERNKLIAAEEKKGNHDLFLYESSLLVEAGTYRDFDRVIVVYCNTDTQVQRLMIRDKIDKTEAEKRIRSQLPLSEKLKMAHYTIDTGGSVDQTYKISLEIYSLIRRDFNKTLNLLK